MNQIDPSRISRPPFLKTLCILSWISAGLSIISSSLYKMVSGKINQSFNFITDDAAKEEIMLQMEFLDKNSLWIVVLYLGSVLGVYLMWNRNRNGFFIYSGVQILLVLLPFTFFPFDILDLLLSSVVTLIFIFMYYKNLYFMRD